MSAAHLKQLVDGGNWRTAPHRRTRRASFRAVTVEVGIAAHRTQPDRAPHVRGTGLQGGEAGPRALRRAHQKDLPRGKWRHLREKEVTLLKRIR